jgi:hypothetical protein
LITFDENDAAKLSLADACRAGWRKHVVFPETDVPLGHGRQSVQAPDSGVSTP